MREILVFVLLFSGAFFMVMAGLGLLRMPDLFTRMSATAKAGTLGIGLILLGAALYLNQFSIYTRVFAIIFFVLLTAPVAAHMIGRAAYFNGTPLWSHTVLDELSGHYHRSSHALDTEVVPAADQVDGYSEPQDEEREGANE